MITSFSPSTHHCGHLFWWLTPFCWSCPEMPFAGRKERQRFEPSKDGQQKQESRLTFCFHSQDKLNTDSPSWHAHFRGERYWMDLYFHPLNKGSCFTFTCLDQLKGRCALPFLLLQKSRACLREPRSSVERERQVPYIYAEQIRYLHWKSDFTDISL